VADSINSQLVSIIIVSYKNLEYIFETIDSILMQDYPNIELIISDDCSEKFDDKLYRDYVEKNNRGNISNIIVHQNDQNLGTVKNINNAIKMSNGSIIKSIAADDAFYNNSVISSLVDYIETNNSLVVVSRIITCDADLEIINNISCNREFDDILKPTFATGDKLRILLQLYICSFIPAPGVFYTKKLFEKYGYFDETYRLLEDWPMWIRLVKEGCKIDICDQISVKYRTNVGISMTPNKIYIEDNIQCYKKEILPDLKDFNYWSQKKIRWYNTRKWEYDQYSTLGKVEFIIRNIDFVLFYLIPNKMKDI